MNIKSPNRLAAQLGTKPVLETSPEHYAPVFGAIYPREKISLKPSVVQKQKPEVPRVLRLTMKTRRGVCWTFPYSAMGLIECVSPSKVEIHCNGEVVSVIEITGTGLDALIPQLSTNTLEMIEEVQAPEFAKGRTVVSGIRVVRASRCSRESGGGRRGWNGVRRGN